MQGAEGLMMIVSGGQTGVDRGALDAALQAGFACGGWCPEGRRAEDGPIAARYPLRELPGGDYAQRTRRNVELADATVIVSFGRPRGGTALTASWCRRLRCPWLLLDGESFEPDAAAGLLAAFVDQYRVATLNVAGPRASGDARGYPFARALIGRLLADRG